MVITTESCWKVTLPKPPKTAISLKSVNELAVSSRNGSGLTQLSSKSNNTV